MNDDAVVGGERLDSRPVGQVGGHESHSIRRKRGAFFKVASAAGDGMSRCCEPARGRTAQTTGGPGDEDLHR
ncbi:hypothetical protein DLREEDagr8_26110 [Dongia sp. agr-C8]